VCVCCSNNTESFELHLLCCICYAASVVMHLLYIAELLDISVSHPSSTHHKVIYVSFVFMSIYFISFYFISFLYRPCPSIDTRLSRIL
jgi:uncharacterized BrkB/YihY/UPF0761 family membrane protein